MAKCSILLDFQHDAIDWILMRSGLRYARIEKSGQLNCPGNAADNPATLAALQQLCKSLEVSGLACVASIDGQELLIRHITVPFGEKRKVRQILPLELEATLPVAADELALDFQMVGRDDGHTAIAVATPYAQIEAYVQLLQEAGLDPILITFSGLPAAALLAARAKDESVTLLIDGDQHHAMLFIVVGRQIRFIRRWRQPSAGDATVELLKATIDHTLEAAAQLLPDDTELSAIYLTPKSTRFFSLDALSTNQCPAVIFDASAFAGVALEGPIPVDHGQGALTVGLYEPFADRGLNLFRSTFPLKRFVLQHRLHFIRIGVLAAVFIALYMFNIYLDISRAEKRAAFLESQAAAILQKTFPETRNVIDPLQQMTVKMREIRSQGFASSRSLPASQIDILNAISTALPKTLDIRVSQLVSSMERVQISGTTNTCEAVNKAKQLLEQTAIFSEITIVSANMDQNNDQVRFKLTIDLKKAS
jgi:type II secretion system protein L